MAFKEGQPNPPTASLEYVLNGVALTSKPRHVGHARERELLMAFFETTGGKSNVPAADLKKLGKEPKSSWRRTGGWDPAISPTWHHEYVCAFYGVELHDSGDVKAMRLGGNGLVETFPGRMLGGLGRLHVLDLGDNDLRGGLMDERTLEAWPELTHLVLSDNPHLGGAVPAALPQCCRNLVVLQLHNAGLTGELPPALISLLPHLRAVLLHENAFEGASPCTLVHGEAKDEDKWPVGSGASELGTALAVAKAKGKFRKGLTKSKDAAAARKATAAARRAAKGGGGGGDDEEAEKMALSPHHRSLTRLSCHRNKLSGPLGVLSAFLKLKLKDLSLGGNAFTGPVEPLFATWQDSSDGRCALQRLALDRNCLEGRFPRTLSCVRFTLQALDLSHNQLSGPVEGRVVAQLTLLKQLNLSHNRFTGPLPDALSSLATSLQSLVVGHNFFTGPLPCGALASLTALRTLDLQHNRLEGAVQPFFGRMAELRDLNLGFNELQGPMPLPQLGAFQRAKPPSRRLKVCVLQPNPRMVQPTEAEVLRLSQDLPLTNIAVAWKRYTF